MAVVSPMASSVAISRFDLPAESSLMTSTSRDVKPPIGCDGTEKDDSLIDFNKYIALEMS